MRGQLSLVVKFGEILSECLVAGCPSVAFVWDNWAPIEQDYASFGWPLKGRA